MAWTLVLLASVLTASVVLADSDDNDGAQGKRAHLSVNQPMSILSGMYKNKNRNTQHNPLLSLGKRDQSEEGDFEETKRAPLSVNQPMSLLSDMYTHKTRGNPLLALGKRDADDSDFEVDDEYYAEQMKRTPLSVNQAMSALSGMYRSREGNGHNPLLSLGKRVRLSVNQPLNVLAGMVGNGKGGRNYSPLLALGKRVGVDSSIFDSSSDNDYDDDVEEKRAALSVNQPMNLLSQMYGDDGDRSENPLLRRGKRAQLSVNQPLSVLSGLIRDSNPTTSRLHSLGKRKALSVNQAMNVLSAMYNSARAGSRQNNPLLSLGKRTSLSVNSAMAALSDLIQHTGARPNRLLSLGKRPQLSVNQPLSILSSIMSSSEKENSKENPLLRLGKRGPTLSFTQDLSVLRDLMSSNSRQRQNRLTSLGKRDASESS